MMMDKKSIPVPWGGDGYQSIGVAKARVIREGYSRNQLGFSTLGWLFAVPLFFMAFLMLILIFYEGRKAYWDAQVREMCAKDGGVKIFEQLRVSPMDITFLGRLDGKISVPSKESASSNAPAYSEFKIKDIREGSPRVWRSESTIRRRKDQVIVAQWVTYTRAGGDFPSPAHDSSFTCPDLKTITNDLQKLFIVEGGLR